MTLQKYKKRASQQILSYLFFCKEGIILWVRKMFDRNHFVFFYVKNYIFLDIMLL